MEKARIVPFRTEHNRWPWITRRANIVVEQTLRDARFERRGRDLWHVETVSIVDAVLGVTVETPTLDGPTQVSIPPGTQPDAVLRLRNRYCSPDRAMTS